jgi:hypothetical protein
MKDLRCMVGMHNYVQVPSTDEVTGRSAKHQHGEGFFVACTRCRRSTWVRVDPTTPNPSLDLGWKDVY